MHRELLSLLKAHETWDSYEQACHTKILEVSSVSEIFSSTFFSPGHFTASAFVLSPDDAEILLIFHPGFQKWIQPGGHVSEEDSSLQETALRELQEETAIHDVEILEWIPAILDVDIHSVPASSKKQQPAHEHYDVRFVFRARSKPLTSSGDIAKMKWVSIEEIEDVDTDGSVRRALRRIAFHHRNRTHVE